MGFIEDNKERFYNTSTEKNRKFKEFASLHKVRNNLPVCRLVMIFQRKLGTNRKKIQKNYYMQFKSLFSSGYGLDDVYPWFIDDGVLVCAVYLRGKSDIDISFRFNSSGTITNFS